MKGLLEQYMSKINYDPRVFSQEVMTPQEFEAPFDQWIRQMTEQTLKPEFLRYQYDPFKQQSMRQLQDLNQTMGSSGAWRTGAANRDMNTAVNDTQRAEEQLWRQYNDQALQTRDAFKSAWSDPLYKSRMESFYNAPWRNAEVGDVSATTTPTDSRLQGFDSTTIGGGTQNVSPYTGATGTQSLSGYAGRPQNMFFQGYDPRSSGSSRRLLSGSRL